MIQRAFLVVSFLLFFVPSGLWACTCSNEPPGKCPALQPDDVVFLGTVTDVANVPPAPADANATDSANATGI
ncbi:MAG: hypothetical protein WBY66_00325, partial [Candidatus Acidiferrales bacterium]